MQKKLKIFSVIILLILFISSCNTYGASFSVYASKSTLYIGDTATVTIDATGVAGTISSVTSSNSAVSVSGQPNWVDDNKVTFSIKGNSIGNATITVTGKVASYKNDKDESDVTKTININVVEKPKSTTNNNKTTSNNTKTTTTAKAATTSTKSSNNYLKSLQISEEGLTPSFLKTKTNYSLNVGLKVTNLEVNAVAEDSKAKVSVTGNKDLKEGDNNVVITVTAENGSQRTYTIIVNKSDKPEKSNSYLANLIIRDMTLTPEFSSEVLEYDGGVIKTNDTTLDIFASPTNENAKVEILGNENLILGENIITIKVTSEDGTSTKEYKVKFIREEGIIEENAMEDVDNIDSPKQGIKAILKDIWQTIKENSLVLLMYLLIIVEYIQIVYLYKKLKKAENSQNNDDTDDKKSFDQFNIKLDESKIEEKPLLESIPKEEVESLPEDTSEVTEESNVEQPKEDIQVDEEIERKVRTIWDEDRPNFLEDVEEETKKRRSGRSSNK